MASAILESLRKKGRFARKAASPIWGPYGQLKMETVEEEYAIPGEKGSVASAGACLLPVADGDANNVVSGPSIGADWSANAPDDVPETFRDTEAQEFGSLTEGILLDDDNSCFLSCCCGAQQSWQQEDEDWPLPGCSQPVCGRSSTPSGASLVTTATSSETADHAFHTDEVTQESPLTTVIGFEDLPCDLRDLRWTPEITGEVASPFQWVVERPTEPRVVQHRRGCTKPGCFGQCMGRSTRTVRTDTEDRARLIARVRMVEGEPVYTYSLSSEPPVDPSALFARPVAPLRWF